MIRFGKLDIGSESAGFVWEYFVVYFRTPIKRHQGAGDKDVIQHLTFAKVQQGVS